MKKTIALIAVIFLFVSCGSQNLKEYYFNPDNFKEKKYYKYVNQDNPNDFFFWELIGKGDTLITNAYSSGHYLTSESAEVVDKESAKVIQMMRYEGASPDDVKKLEGEFIAFDHEGPYILKTTFVGQDGLITTHQERKFVEFTTINYKGKDEKAMVLQKEEEYHFEKYDERFTIKQTDYYIENLGLVRYERETPSKTYHYELEEILSEEEWQKELEIDKVACNICLLRDSIIQLELKAAEIADCIDQESVENYNTQYKSCHQNLKNLKKRYNMSEKYALKKCIKTYDFTAIYDDQQRDEQLKKYYGFTHCLEPFKITNIDCIDFNKYGESVGNGKHRFIVKGKYEIMTHKEFKEMILQNNDHYLSLNKKIANHKNDLFNTIINNKNLVKFNRIDELMLNEYVNSLFSEQQKEICEEFIKSEEYQQILKSQQEHLNNPTL